MSKAAWVIIAMIIWTLISLKWYCDVKGACSANEVAAPVVKEVAKEAPIPVIIEPEPAPVVKEVPVAKEAPKPTEVMEKKEFVCTDYLTGSLKLGRSQNTAADAKKVEEFLTQYEDANLAVDGVYGPADEAAVRKFQAKYKAQVLDPHGLTGPTGHVLSTTRAQINKLYCGYKSQEAS